MERFKGGIHIDAPVEDVWDIITKTYTQSSSISGVEEVTISPIAERLEPGMGICLKVGFAAIRGLIHIRIDEVNDERHYFSTSLLGAELERPMKIEGIRGRTMVGLWQEARNGDEGTNLQYISQLRVPLFLRPLIVPIKLGLVDAGILPSVGEKIATAAQKRHS